MQRPSTPMALLCGSGSAFGRCVQRFLVFFQWLVFAGESATVEAPGPYVFSAFAARLPLRGQHRQNGPSGPQEHATRLNGPRWQFEHHRRSPVRRDRQWPSTTFATSCMSPRGRVCCPPSLLQVAWLPMIRDVRLLLPLRPLVEETPPQHRSSGRRTTA